jgi:ABC-type Fe3+ transport system permease subunit
MSLDKRTSSSVAFFVLALIFFIPSCTSALIAAKTYAEANGSNSHYFFQICSTISPGDCTQFSWLALLGVGLSCIIVSISFAMLGTKKWKATNTDA